MQLGPVVMSALSCLNLVVATVLLGWHQEKTKQRMHVYADYLACTTVEC